MNQTLTRSLFHKHDTTLEGAASLTLPHPRLSAGAKALALILPMLASLIAAILIIAQ